MQALTSLAFYLGVVAYSAASTLFFLELLRPASPRRWASSCLAAGGVFHAGHVIAGSVLSNVCPVESLHFGLSFSALMAVAAYFALRRRFRLDALGVLVAPLALTFLLGAQFVSEGSSATSNLPRGLLLLHIAANVIGVGLFLLAGASGAFYVVEERRLKQKRLGTVSRMPPLAVLDRASHRLLLAGFPLLTFGIVTGSLFMDRLQGFSGGEWLRASLGYASWLLLAVVLVLRRTAGFSGRRAAYGTLAGVGCVLLVMLAYVLRATPG